MQLTEIILGTGYTIELGDESVIFPLVLWAPPEAYMGYNYSSYVLILYLHQSRLLIALYITDHSTPIARIHHLQFAGVSSVLQQLIRVVEDRL